MRSRGFYFSFILGLAALLAVIGGLSGCSTASTPTTQAATTTPPVSTTLPPTSSAAPPTTSSLAPLTVNVSNNPKLGGYLVDGSGMTLYYFARDSMGKSTTTGTTLTNWPLFSPSNFMVPSTLNASDFGSITRDDGAKVATYKGWPLYYYINDKVSGDANGQGIGGVWFVVTPANFPPTPTAAPSTSITPSVTAGATATPTPTATPSPSPSATITPAAPVPYSVVIQNFAFSPASITIPVGSTVTWTNKDSGILHTVTSDTGVFNGSVNSGSTFSYTFTQAGTFPYHCTIHPSMTAKVVVQ